MSRDGSPMTVDSLYLLFARAVKWALLIGAGFVVGIVIFILAVQRNVDLVVEQRAESRIQMCGVLKAFAVGHNAKVLADAVKDNEFIVLLATDGGRKPIDPEDQAIVDGEITENNRLRDENLVPVPDCSTAQGIRDLFEKQ